MQLRALRSQLAVDHFRARVIALRPRLPPDRPRSHTPAPAAPATRSSAAGCPASPSDRPHRRSACSIASRSNTHSPDARKHDTGSSANSCAASPRSDAHCLPPPRDLFRRQPVQLPPVPLLLPSVAQIRPRFTWRTPPQTTTEKSVRISRLLRPLPLLVEKSATPRSASTPAQSRRPAPPPPATTPAPRRLLGPTAKPPSNADSGSSARAPHSLSADARQYSLSSRGNTNCRAFLCEVRRNALPHFIRQVLPEPPHNPENVLRRFPVLRHLHAQRAPLRDRLHEKSRRNVRRDPHLPRLQHHILLRAPPGILPLRPVQSEKGLV